VQWTYVPTTVSKLASSNGRFSAPDFTSSIEPTGGRSSAITFLSRLSMCGLGSLTTNSETAGV
jgi:hypothetical protein